MQPRANRCALSRQLCAATALTTHLVVAASRVQFFGFCWTQRSSSIVSSCVFVARPRDGAAHAKEARKKVQVYWELRIARERKKTQKNNNYARLSNATWKRTQMKAMQVQILNKNWKSKLFVRRQQNICTILTPYLRNFHFHFHLTEQITEFLFTLHYRYTRGLCLVYLRNTYAYHLSHCRVIHTLCNLSIPVG